MKVILNQDIKALGKKGSIVDVNKGYAKNYLLPQGLAKEANNANLNTVKLQNQHKEKLEQEQYEKALELKNKIDNAEVLIEVKMGKDGKLFGSVSNKEIAQAIKEQLNLEVDKKKIVLNQTIKNMSISKVKIKLHAKVQAELTVRVDGIR